jgi:ubiquitin-like domain-containing CTD phosphatase 1
MGPLWSEIMTNILPIVDPTNHPSSSSSSSSGTPPPPKLGLFSGHDTTLMPILATLGDKVWPGTEWAP